MILVQDLFCGIDPLSAIEESVSMARGNATEDNDDWAHNHRHNAGLDSILNLGILENAVKRIPWVRFVIL